MNEFVIPSLWLLSRCVSLGFYELSEVQSPKGRSGDPIEVLSSWAYTSDRPKSVGKNKMEAQIDR